MGRVLCTYDPDYIQLASEGAHHTGIVFGQPEDHYIGEWVKYLEQMHAVYASDEMKDRIEYL